MVAKKPTSKRKTIRQQYKVKKKVAEAKRKRRKEGMLKPKKTKRDPGIPNLFPLKEKILLQIKEQKEKEEEQKQARKAANVPDPLPKKKKQDTGDRSEHQKPFYRELNKVLGTADVILQVLDARDPIGTRARHVEEMLRAAPKAPKVVLVVNKVDLVPKEILQGWLSLLRRELPTVAFKGNTQGQRQNLSRGSVDAEQASEKYLQASTALGVDSIMHVLKNYARTSTGMKTSITVGVIGYPNVGKSTLINSLKRSRVCAVGAMPGVTKTMQEVHLDKNIRLLDCPGIVFSPFRSNMSEEEAAEIMLRNCVRIEALDDPGRAVALIVQRASPTALMQLYKIPDYSSSEEFLAHVARSRGKMLRGGVPDVKSAARCVLVDWNRGLIPYYTIPPQAPVSGGRVLVNQLASEMDIDKLDQQVDSSINNLKSINEMNIDFVALSAVHQVPDYDLSELKSQMHIALDEPMDI